MVNSAERNPSRNYFFSEEMKRMDLVLRGKGIASVSAMQVLRAPAKAVYQLFGDPDTHFLVHENGAWSHRHANGTVHQTGLGVGSLATYVGRLARA